MRAQCSLRFAGRQPFCGGSAAERCALSARRVLEQQIEMVKKERVKEEVSYEDQRSLNIQRFVSREGSASERPVGIGNGWRCWVSWTRPSHWTR